MANWSNNWKGFQADADINSAVVDVPDPGADLAITAFRFPVAGRLRAAYVVPKATLAAGTTNYYAVSLKNGSTAGTAATAVSGTAGGTVGWTAQTPTTISLTAGSENFAAGEWVVINYDEEGTVAPAFVVQIDYSLNPTS